MEVVLLLAFGFAVARAIDHGRATRQSERKARLDEIAQRMPGGVAPKGRRRAAVVSHDAAWWFGEVFRGFPVHRTGWHAGWIQHKTEAVHQRAVRDQARDQHEDVRNAVRESRAERTARRAVQTTAVDKELAADPRGGKKAAQDAVGNVVQGPWTATRRIDGQPETPADTRFFDQRESGYRGPIDQDGYAVPSGERTGVAEDADGNPHLLIVRPDEGYFGPGPGVKTADESEAHRFARERSLNGTPQDVTTLGPDGQRVLVAQYRHGRPVPIPATSNGGTPVAASTAIPETTYNQTHQELTKLINETESEIAVLHMRRLAERAEQIFSAGVGGATASALADASDASAEQLKAAQKQLDSLQAAKSNLTREHGQGAEYHQSRPNGGASREFLKE